MGSLRWFTTVNPLKTTSQLRRAGPQPVDGTVLEPCVEDSSTNVLCTTLIRANGNKRAAGTVSGRLASTATDRLVITRPDDWHLHVRDGEGLKSVVPHTAEHFSRAIIMPNLVPPVTTAQQASCVGDSVCAGLVEVISSSQKDIRLSHLRAGIVVQGPCPGCSAREQPVPAPDDPVPDRQHAG